MAVPTQAELYRSILRWASVSRPTEAWDNRVDPLDVLVDLVSRDFNLTDADRQEVILYRESKIRNRIRWAKYELKQAGILHSPSRNFLEMTQQGQEFLDKYGGKIPTAILNQLSVNSRQADGSSTETAGDNINSDADTMPEDLMAWGDQHLQKRLADELLDNIIKLTPGRFERLVVNLLEKMGYGEGQVVGRSRDGGIDGIINQDPLGLEKVYIQAKRWSNQVGEPEIRNFSGSLDAKGAAKGVFITTSTFSGTAEQTAKNISTGSKFIRLIDGQELAVLMVQQRGRRGHRIHLRGQEDRRKLLCRGCLALDRKYSSTVHS